MAFTDIVLRNRGSNLSPRQMDHLNIVRRNNERLNGLIDDLLDVSRISAGILRIELVKFDVAPVLEKLVEGLRPIFESKDQTVLSNLSSEPLWIEADQDRIEQVISNLLSNASKYSPADSEVEFRSEVIRNSIVISVRDQRIGISSTDIDQIYEPVFRADNSETLQESGTGLGLFITKSIIDMHGGTIEIDSTPDVGAPR